jgi:hypothetical protein
MDTEKKELTEKTGFFQNEKIRNIIIAIASSLILGLLSGTIAKIWSLSYKLEIMQGKLDEVHEMHMHIEDFEDRIQNLEITGVGQVAFAQLSSTITQRPNRKGIFAINMENWDAIPGRAVRCLPAPLQCRTSGFPASGSSIVRIAL